MAITDWGNLVPKGMSDKRIDYILNSFIVENFVLYLLNISVEGQSLQLAASVVVKERSLFIIRVMYFIQVPGGGQKEESLHHQVPGGGQPRHFL